MINFFLVALAALFTYFKITATTAVATWSWFWVLSPIIIPYIAVFGFVVLLLLVALITGSKPNIQIGGRKNIQRRF